MFEVELYKENGKEPFFGPNLDREGQSDFNLGTVQEDGEYHAERTKCLQFPPCIETYKINLKWRSGPIALQYMQQIVSAWFVGIFDTSPNM